MIKEPLVRQPDFWGYAPRFLIWKGNTAKKKETFCYSGHSKMKQFSIAEHVTSLTEKRTAMLSCVLTCTERVQLLQRIKPCPDLSTVIKHFGQMTSRRFSGIIRSKLRVMV